MANNCELNSIKCKSISSSNTNRNKLLKLAEGIKTRKKSSTLTLTTNNNIKSSSNIGYDRALTNIEHLVFGTYKTRPTTPLIHDNHSQQSNSDSPKSQTNDLFCECRAHTSPVKSIHFDNNDNSLSKFINLSPIKKCNECENVSKREKLLMNNQNEDELDVTLINDDMDIDSNLSHKEEESLILGVQQLTTNERTNGIISKIPKPKPISNKQTRNLSTSAINTSTNKQKRSKESFGSNGSVGSDFTKETENTNGLKQHMSKISLIPKPLINTNSGLKSCEINTSLKSLNDKISSNELITKKHNSLTPPLIKSSLEMPVIPNLHLLKTNSRSPFGMSNSRACDPRFAKIRSTLHANKRMPSLYLNHLRRHNSLLDPNHRSYNSYQTRFKQTKLFTDETTYTNSRLIKDSKITNTSTLNSHLSSLSTETKRTVNTKCDKNGINRGVTQSSSYSKVIESLSTQPENNESLDIPKHEVSKSKSHSNLQRNRPQVKTPSGRIRTPMKSRSNSISDSKPLPPIDRGVNRAASDPISSQKSIISDNFNENYVTNHIHSNKMNKFCDKDMNQFDKSESYSSKMKMFIMDEDNIPVSPKRLSKTDHKFRQNDKLRKSKNKEEKCSDKSTFKQYLYETYVNKSVDISPEQLNTPPIVPLRSRSTSDHHLSSILLIEAQKEAINEFEKTSRPWSHIYSESEAKRILKDTKSFGGVVNSDDLVINYKPKSENDILDSLKNKNLPKSPVKSNSESPTHLENGSQESVLQRFKKTFSLRFSRNANINRSESPVQNKLRSSVRTKSEDKTEETQKTMWYDLNYENNQQLNEVIINQDFNNDKNESILSTEYEEKKNKLVETAFVERQHSTPHPIKARDQMHRKISQKCLIRKHSNRSRLRRSVSHPNHSFEKWSTNERIISRENSSHLSSESESESLSGKQYSPLSRQTSEQKEFDDDVVYAEALWDHMSLDPEELVFRAGEVIDISDSSDKDWWWGTINAGIEDRCGWFPASFVRMRVSQNDTLEECMTKIADGTLRRTPKKRLSISALSNEQVRANVVLEIINTERDFVKHLKDVIDGYLNPCRNRSDMFCESRINTIFSNIEQLYEFQLNFLNQLELAIDWEHISDSLIGDSFLRNEKGFIVYCEFCKNHPLAISELQDLYSDEKYVVFFEGCRLIQNMIDISLDGFLLTPIQKICKYPLQLGELLKYTRTDHKDYTPVTNAYACMQRVAQLVNEKKRRFESLEHLIALQERFDGWEGLPLIEICSVLIHSGEVNRLTTSSWTKDVTLFLFDRWLIFCKKDTGILKRGTYAYKSRIDLDTISSIIDIEDGTKDTNFNIIVKNGFKFYSESKQKWYLFQTKTIEDKHNWLKAFADERKRVCEDREQDFIVTEKDKLGAKMAHLNSLKPKKPRIKRPNKSRRPDTAVVEIALDPPHDFIMDRNRAGSLPSYMHSDKSVVNNSKVRQPVIKKNRSNWFHLGSSKKTKGRIKRSLK